MSEKGSVSQEAVLDALRHVMDPDLHRDIVSLGFVKELVIQGGEVSFQIELTTPACPAKDALQKEAHDRVAALPGVSAVRVKMTSRVRQSSAGMAAEVLRGVKHAIAVASGKGGVGKSTVAVNLAAALAQSGASVGLLDADVYGPSIPIMLGLKTGRPEVQRGKLTPLERYGIHLMSLGFLTGEDTPVIWRGPLVGKLIKQFLSDVEWGDLDYLVVDLPPGTGDAQLTLTQAAPLAGAVIVTTPQDVALEDVRRAVHMFEKVNVPVLGIVENMAYFVCPSCGARHEIFAHGGGAAAAKHFDVPFLGEIPLLTAIREGGDQGVPSVVSDPESPQSAAFQAIAGELARQLSILSFPETAEQDAGRPGGEA